MSAFSLWCPVTAVLTWSDRYLPQYGTVARGHDAAVLNGTLSGLNTTLDTQYPV